MTSILDLRCDPEDADGLRQEISRRDKIIRSLIHQVEHNLNARDTDYALLQNTFMLEEQVRARTDELKKSVEALEAFMANASVGILLTRDRQILRHNRKFGEMFGFAGDDAIGRPGRLLFRSDEEYAELGRLATPLLSAAQPFHTETYMCRQDGSDLWINLIGYVSNAEETLQGTIWILEDRTDFKRADDALRRSYDELEERVAERTAELSRQLHFLQQLIEAIPGPVFYKDAQVRYLGCNSAFEAFIGLPASELIGKTPHDIAPTELADKYLAADRELLDKPGSQIYESLVRYANGEMRDVMFHKATFTRPDGTVGGLIGLMLDITDRKQAESAVRKSAEEIRRLNEDLEVRVKERTAQLEAVIADLESFSYSVSHDLRVPLRAINGFASIIREDYAGALDDEGSKLFQAIGKNAQLMEQLIDDILAFARAGRHEMQTERLNMKALAEKVWQGLESQRSGRNIEFRLRELPACIGDPAAVHQVLQNLMANAVKFSRGREPAIIEIGGGASGAENIYFVKDNGAGFDTAYANKLFGIFQRLHGVKDFEGTGIGLAVVKCFVVKLGGRVWAESKQGEGATFWFSLPSAKTALTVLSSS